MSNKPNVVNIMTLFRHKRLLCLSSLGCALLAAAALQILKPGYEVGARLWVERLSMPDEHADIPLVSKDFIPTQAEIIRSPAVLNKALAELNIQLEEGVTYEEFLTSVIERLSVDPLIGTNVLSVRFRDGDRQRAIDTVQSIIDHYCNYVQLTEKDTHRETLQLLTQQDEKLRGELTVLHERQRELRVQIADATEVKESAKVRETLLADHAQSLTIARSRRMQLEHHVESFFSPKRLAEIFDEAPETARVAHRESSTRFVSLTTPILPTQSNELKQAIDVLSRMSREDWLGLDDPTPIREALLEAQAEESRTIHRYGEKHPNLMAVRDRIEALNARLLESVKSAPEALDRELESIRNHEESLAKLYENELASIQAEIEKSKVIDGLTLNEKHVLDEIQRVQTSHDAITARMKQWELMSQAVAGGRLGVVVRMLEEPSAILTGIQAPLPLTIGIAGLLGLMGGAVVVSQLEQRKHTVAATEEL